LYPDVGGNIETIAFSADGRALAVAGRRTKLYRVETGLQRRRLAHAGATPYTVAFHPTQPLLVAAQAKDATLWDAATGKAVRTWAACGTDEIESLVFGPTGDRLAAGTRNSPQGLRVHLWETKTWTALPILQANRNHKSSAVGLAFDHAGKRVAAVSRDGHMLIWDCALDQLPLYYPSAPDPVRPLGRLGGTCLSFANQDLNLLVVNNAHIERWNLADIHLSGQSSADLLFFVSGERNVLHMLAAQNLNGEAITILEAPELKVTRLLKAEPAEGQLSPLAFSPDGRVLAGVNSARRLVLWDTVSWQRLASIPIETTAINRLAFSGDGRYLAFVGELADVFLYDLRGLQDGLRALGLD
jgi:WD40 repeat protein